jgi:predicted permease
MLILESNMRVLRAFLFRLAGLFHKEKSDHRIAEEMESHLRMHIEDNLRAGMTPDQARRDALIKSGGLEPAKEAYRDRRGLPFIETLLHDFRYAIRMIRKSPGFTVVVVLTLALGIGANTAIFSVMNAALRPIAIPAPDRAVMVWTENPKRDWHQFPTSLPDYLDWKASGVFSSLGALEESGFNLRFDDRTERIDGLSVNPELFEALARTPQLGRLFRPEDMQPGNDQIVILSDGLWRSRFAGDPAIAGKKIVIEGTPYTVIGVLPQDFPRFGHEEIYTPLIVLPPAATERGSRNLELLGRLRPGLRLAAAQQRMTELGIQLAQKYPQTNTGCTIRLQPLAEAYVEDAQQLLAILLGAVGFVLLITCANIANLLLARGTSRSKEMAIRTALGGTRWRLSRQLLTENLLLALMGGVLAVLPAVWGMNFISSYHLDQFRNTDLITLNSTVLTFNFVLSLLTGLLFGLVPAWQIRRTDVNSTLKAAAKSHSGGFHQHLRGIFVVSEVALTLVLLVGASLVLQSFLRLRATDPGYNAQNLLTMKIALADRQYSTPEKQIAFFEQVVGRARTLPGVVTAGATDEIPTSDNIHGSGLYTPENPNPRTEDIPLVLYYSVTSDYFRAMQMPLLHGRYLNDSDRKSSTLVVVVDDWMAKRYWPGQDPVGKRLKLGGKEPWREIVGVVGTVQLSVLELLLRGKTGQVYLPLAQKPRPWMTLVLRSETNPAALIPAMRDVVRNIDIDQPIFKVQTMEEARAAGRASTLLATWLLGAFAVVALLLAAIGIYGLVAYNVGQRTREFGIRMSLGAQPRDVLRVVVRQGIILIAAGISIGLAGAFAITRLMSDLLYGIRATDPLTFAEVSGLLAAVALLASYIPARRATKIDPVIALRSE